MAEVLVPHSNGLLRKISRRLLGTPRLILCFSISWSLTGAGRVKVALCVGVGDRIEANKHPIISRLHSPAIDCRRMSTALQHLGFTCTTLSNERATKDNIIVRLKEITDYASNQPVSPEGPPVIVVYFSGHGMLDGAGNQRLVPYITTPVDESDILV